MNRGALYSGDRRMSISCLVNPLEPRAHANHPRVHMILVFAMDAKRRKFNFSAAENAFLIDQYEEKQEVLDAAHRDANTNQKKNKAWEEIVTLHSQKFPLVSRTRDDLKMKLSKLKTSAKEQLLQEKKSRAKTGGGQAVPPPNEAVGKIMDLCAETPAFQGLEGADSFRQGMPVILLENNVIIEFYLAADADVDSSPLEEDAEYVSEQSTQGQSMPEPREKNAASRSGRPTKRRPTKRTKQGAPKPSHHGAQWDALVAEEVEMAAIKKQNLLLKQQKLQLQIEILQRQLHSQSRTVIATSTDDNNYTITDL